MADILRLLNEVDELVGIYRGGGIRYFVPHGGMDKQLGFYLSCMRNRETWAFCGNRAGKTQGAMAAFVTRATGIVPHCLRSEVDYVCGSRGLHWIIGQTGDTFRDVLQPKLMELLPSDMIRGRIHYSAGQVLDYIDLVNGHKIVAKTYKQDVETFAGAKVDTILFDEEPPELHYKEAVMRTIDRAGHIFGALTPVNGMDWIYEQIYERGIERGVRVFNWDMDDNPHLSDKAKASILAGYTIDELRIRKEGKFLALTGLVIPQFDERRHVLRVA